MAGALEQLLERVLSPQNVRGLFIGGLVVGLAGLGLHEQMQRSARAAHEPLVRAMEDMLAGRQPPASVLNSRPPRDRAGKVLWVSVVAAEDARRELAHVYERYGIAGFDPPSVWLTDLYFTRIEDFPEIRSHWQGYERFELEYGDSVPLLVQRVVDQRAKQAGLSKRLTKLLHETIAQRMVANHREREAKLTIARHAQALHGGIANSRGGVRVVRGEYVFDSPMALSYYNTYRPLIQKAARELEELQKLRKERMQMGLAELPR